MRCVLIWKGTLLTHKMFKWKLGKSSRKPQSSTSGDDGGERKAEQQSEKEKQKPKTTETVPLEPTENNVLAKLEEESNLQLHAYDKHSDKHQVNVTALTPWANSTKDAICTTIKDAENISVVNVVNPQAPVTVYQYDDPDQKRLDRVWKAIQEAQKNEYQRLKIPKLPWLSHELTMKNYYIDLSLKLKTDQEINDIHLHEIFKSSNRIFIEGSKGYGKSILSRKLCYDHAMGEQYIQHYDVVVLIRLREFDGTLEKIITETIGLKDYDSELVMEAIKQRQEKVLIILDGFDELPRSRHDDVVPLLDGKQLPKAGVIVTSRRLNVKEKRNIEIINLVECMQTRVLISGIRGENRMRFIETYVDDPNSLSAIKTMMEDKFGLLSESEEKNLFDSPLLLLLLVTVAEEPYRQLNIMQINTKTDLYKEIFNIMLRRRFMDPTKDFFHFDVDDPPAYVRMLCEYGEFAFKAYSSESEYSFSEEEILSHCSNDDSIFLLGILTQSDSKIGKRRRNWFEPVHLTFLDFTTAYFLWVSLMRSPKLESFFCSRGAIMNSLETNVDTLGLPFLFGICREELLELCTALAQRHDAKLWLEKLACYCDGRKLLAESRFQLSELAKVLVPLVPTAYDIPEKEWKRTALLKATLTEALASGKLKRLSYTHNLDVDFVAVTSHSACLRPMNVVPSTLLDYQKKLPEAWCEIVTHQNLLILDTRNFLENSFDFKICESRLQQQLAWLDSFMVIKGIFKDKPIYEICYQFSGLKVVKALKYMKELVHRERVESVCFTTTDAKRVMCHKEWEDFLFCASQSKQLSDIFIKSHAKESLFVDLKEIAGKTWKKVKLVENVIPCSGIPVSSCAKSFDGDLNSFSAALPANVECLSMQFGARCRYQTYLFVRDLTLPLVCNTSQIFLTINKDSDTFLQISSWENLSNLQVLGIAFSEDFEGGIPKDYCQSIISRILAIISHCPVLERLELWDYCSEEFVTNLVHNLHSSAKEGIQLGTLMLSHKMSYKLYVPVGDVLNRKKDVPESKTVQMLKELLLSRCLRHLWVSGGYPSIGYANPNFVKLFSSSEGFVCAISETLVQQPDRWDLKNCVCDLEIISIDAL